MKTDIQTQHYIFTDNNRARPCDVYNFHVTARNDAGIGNSSEIVTGSLPSLPDISAVEDSLQHSLAKANGSVTLRVQFNVNSELQTTNHKDDNFLLAGGHDMSRLPSDEVHISAGGL